MMPRRFFGALTATLALITTAGAHDAAPAPVPAIVQAVRDYRPIVTLHVGADDGVDLGDRCVILEANRPIAAGTVFYVESRSAGVRLVARTAELRVGQAAFVLPAPLTGKLTEHLPPFAPRYATVTAIAPGGGTAWLDIGTADGAKEGNAIAIIRDGVVTRLGHVTVAEESAALAEFDDSPDAHDAIVGDRVRIQPANKEAPLSVVREAFVTRVSEAPEGQQIVLGGASPLDFPVDRRVDIFRGDAYVGFAVVTHADAGRILARTEASFCQTECHPGDTARLRPPADIEGVVRRGRAFIVDRNYALVSLGANDGVEVGDHLFGSAGGPRTLELVIQSVYPDHCGAALADDSAQSVSIPQWAEFRNTRIEDAAPRVGKVVSHALVPWLAEAHVDDDAAPPAPGTLLAAGGPSPAFVLVIDSHPNEMLLYTPTCWRLDVLDRRPVRLIEPAAARANEPSVIEAPSADTASMTLSSPDEVSAPPPRADHDATTPPESDAP